MNLFTEKEKERIQNVCKVRMGDDAPKTPTVANLVTYCKEELLALLFSVDEIKRLGKSFKQLPASFSLNGDCVVFNFHERVISKLTPEQKKEKKKVYAKYLASPPASCAARKKFRIMIGRKRRRREAQGQGENDETLLQAIEADIKKEDDDREKFAKKHVYLRLKDVTKLQRDFSNGFRKTLKDFRKFLSETTVRSVDPGCKAVITSVDLFVQDMDVRKTCISSSRKQHCRRRRAHGERKK